MEEVLKYHISDTAKRFDEIRGDLQEIRDSLKLLSEFKIQMIASSRTVSFIVSVVCGAVTLMVSIFAIKH